MKVMRMSENIRIYLLAVSLIPLAAAAWQDMRTRHVSNRITIPLFFLAWPLAWSLWQWDGLVVTGVVFLVTFLAMPYGFGAADGKLAVYLAAVGGVAAALLALVLSLTVLSLSRMFPDLARRLSIIHQEEDGLHIAGAINFFLAAAVFLLVEVAT